MSTEDDTSKLLTEIEQYIDESQRLLDEEKEVDLGGLDEVAARLAERALSIPPEERTRHAADIETMLLKLGTLEKNLCARQSSIANQQRESLTHKRANMAYRTADASDGFGKKKSKKDE